MADFSKYGKAITDSSEKTVPTAVATSDFSKYGKRLDGDTQESPEGVQQADHGFVGNLIAGILKTPARLATNFINAGEAIGGSHIDPATGKLVEGEVTQPFSGSFLGEVKPYTKPKETFGAGLELGSYAVGAPEIKAGAAALRGGELLAKPTLRAAYESAKALAPSGALQGLGTSLQDPDRDLAGNVADTLTGAGGAALLGAGGSLAGRALEKSGIPAKIWSAVPERAKNTAINAANKASDVYNTILGKTRDVLESGVGTKNGKKILTGGGVAERGSTDTSLFRGSEPLTLAEEENRARAVQQYWDPKATDQQNVANLEQAGTEFANKQMDPFLDEHSNPVNYQEMYDYMHNGPKPEGFGRDPVADKTYQDTVNDAIDIMKRKSSTGRDIYTTKDMNNARKEIDTMIRKQEGENALDNSRKKGVVAAGNYIRNRINQMNEDAIKYGDIAKVTQAEKDLQAFGERNARTEGMTYQQKKEALFKNRGLQATPESEKAADQFRQYRKHQKYIIDARKNLQIRSAMSSGKSGLRQMLERNPVTATIVKKVTGAAVPVGAGATLLEIAGK